MRPLILASIVLASGCVSPAAQTQPQAQSDALPSSSYRGSDLAVQRVAIERLSGLVGWWSSVTNVAFPVQRTIYQTESVAPSMDGLLIRGRGYADADHCGAPPFNAFGVISDDDARRVYEMRAHNEGRVVTAEARAE
jgi:hypothetical protein